jgi:histidinol-phosphate phosphatase family protein
VQRRRRVRAVLCDRDGTLIREVPFNGELQTVEPLPGVGVALRRAREAGLAIGIITNQRGLAMGAFALDQLDAVNDRVSELLGPFDVVLYCPHDEAAACDCRKPKPGMVRQAAASLGVDPRECVVIGDTAADVAAAAAAGARAVLVPNSATDPLDVRTAPHVRGSFAAAVGAALEWS